MELIDQFLRKVNYLRVSVTDRCDLRCVYCMKEKMQFLPRKDILSLEEIESKLNLVYEIADIDESGNVDALTDGLVVLRYLFDLRGDSLIGGAIANDAARTDAGDIEDYIQSFMPD